MATYIPNATQTTEPVESRTVESAALEFRTLKASINGRVEDVQDDLDAEIVNRIAGDANLQTQNNSQDVRLIAVENALLSIGEGGLPGTVYVQRLSGTGAQTVFTLDAAPQSNNVVDIYINGLYQNKDTFTVSGTALTFSEAPPAGTDNIEVQVTRTIALGETDASLVTYYGTTVEARLDAISGVSGSSLVGFQPAGAGAIVRTAQDKMRESVKIGDYSSLQAALDTGKPVEVPDGTWTVAGGAVCAANAYIFGAGTLQGDGATPVITVPAGATGVTIEGIKLKGFRLTNESAAGDIGINVQESGVAIRNCEISHFASRGIELASQVADALKYQSVISGCWIHDNGTGVNTNAYEYCRIDGNRITNNGWNNARTGFAPLSSSLGAGIYGNCANSPILNNQVTANAFGIYLIAGLAAPNPDHSIIGFNVINHNGAAGLVMVDLKNYELVIGNTIISNVNITPSVVYAPTGFTEDMALVNAHGLIFTGNTVGTGSDTKLPIFGHGRCRYTNNEFLYGPPTELAVPYVGSPLRDTWGYAVNADNIWRDNWFFAFSRPVLLGSTVRTQVSDNLENGMLIDGSAVSPTMAASWAGVSPAYVPVKFWRAGGDTVHVVGSMLPSAGAGTTAFTLPEGYRPLMGAVDSPAIITSAGAVGMARVYSNGDLEVLGRTVGQTVVLNMTFRCR